MVESDREMITGIQIIEILFAVAMLYLVFLNYKKGDYSKKDFILWMLIFTSFLYAALFPKSFEHLLQPLHVGRALDLVTILGFMVIFGILFIVYNVSRKNQRKIEAIVRKLALEDLEDK